jgi:hypothetical protein
MSDIEDRVRIAELIERDAWLDLFDAAPAQVRRRFGLASDVIAGMGLLGCPGIPITEFNRAMAVGIAKEPTHDDIDAATTWLDAHAVSWALQVAPVGRVDLLRDSLGRAALTSKGAGWAKFIRTAASARGEPLRGPVPVAIADASTADVFGRTVTDGFGLPAECASWFAALVNRPFWQCFLAAVDGEPAACGAMFSRGDAAWFGVETTLPVYRGRGAQQSIIAAQVSAASLCGAGVQTSETAQPADQRAPGASSYRNQLRAGFESAYVRLNVGREISGST